MLIVLLQDVFALGFRFRVRCMSSSADIEVSAVEVGGESKLHEGLSEGAQAHWLLHLTG